MAESNFRRRLLSQDYNTFTVDTSVYLTFVALENDMTVTFSNELQYFISSNKDWVTLPANTESPSIKAGQTISFKANIVPVSNYGVGSFTVSKKFEAMGDPRSLSCGDVMEEIIHGYLGISAYQFYRLFYDCKKLIKVSKNFLPSTRLANYCYYQMFLNCTSLTTVPELPATTLQSYCYEGMFYGCQSLTTTPELPATTLQSYCYECMFWNCTSLTTTPELPATTLQSYCYSEMFRNCTSLTTAPELPATTLADNCYYSMFRDCISLETAPKLSATTLASSCYSRMFYGCTSLTTAPELPATTLAEYCYDDMFYNCRSLTTAPELPATTLDYGCYNSMFDGCTKLTTAPELPATNLATYCYRYMFQYCTSLTTAPELPATTLDYGCYAFMFYSCTKLTTAPSLPATTLANHCYSNMFQYCTSLATAPELPATTLKDFCYYSMFDDCTSLNYIKMSATNIGAIDCLYNWVRSVASTGTFIKHPDMTSLPTGVSGIPSGWTVIDEGTGGGGEEDITLGWTVQSGAWNEESNSSAWDCVSYTCESPGTSGSTVIRYAWSGLTEITFNCVYYGENNYDYLTVGNLDTTCTRDSYKTSLKGNSGTARSITYSCDTGTHYVEFCYSKDGSSDTSPDNATVYIESVNGSGGSSGGTGSSGITWDVQSGTWTEELNGSAINGVQYVCESPGANGSTVIRCTISGAYGASFVIRSQGESSYDYLNAGELDSSCTRNSYKVSLSGNQENNVEVGYTFGDYGTHYVEFCYSKDSSVDTPPDNGVVYLKELL